MNLSLSKKIIIIAVIPLTCFLILGAKINYDSLKNYSRSNELLINIEYFTNTSHLINSTQVERGLSGGYLKGGILFEKLKNHRLKTDSFIMKVSQFNDLHVSPDYKIQIQEHLNQYKLLREKITKKEISALESTKSYTKIVKFFTNYYSVIANSSKFSQITSKIRTLQTLEDVKEHAGLLRVTGTKFLSQNKALNDEKVARIQKLMQGVLFNINSSSLSLSEEALKLKENFLVSKDWKNTKHDYDTIISKRNEGNFGIKPAQFFTEASNAINHLNTLIHYQINETVKNLEAISTNSFNQLRDLFVFLCITVIVLSFFLFKITKSLIKDLTNVSDLLTVGSGHLKQISKDLSKNGMELSESSTQLAAGIQQSSASLEEINAMVKKNEYASTQSSEKSSQSIQVVKKGQTSVQSMIESMNKIDEGNKEIMSFSEKTNSELSSILEIISGIAEKTTLINDIVFQTKLLSFNASVEAARAGEHGKGFSVVAEEIGNLANLSGQSANEINDILERSIKNVETIIQDTGRTFNQLTNDSEKNVKQGIELANTSKNSLEEITSSINNVNTLVSEVSVASQEQKVGVNEITSAIKEIDLVGHQNASLSKNTLNVSKELTDKSIQMEQLAFQLEQIVNGKKESSANGLVLDNVQTLEIKKEDSEAA